MNFTKRFSISMAALAICGAAYALPGDIGVIPSENTTMEALESFSITSGWIELKAQGNEATIMINGQGVRVALSAVSYDELKITLPTPYTAAGDCQIVVPEDTFLIGWEGDPNPLIEFRYIIENDGGGTSEPGGEIMNIVPPGYTFAPEAGTQVETLSSFSVVCDYDYFLATSSRNTGVTINGAPVKAITNMSGDLLNVITWDLAEPITEPGFYTVYIPAGEFFGMDEEDNPPFFVTVEVTGGTAPEPAWYPGEMASDPISGSEVAEIEKVMIFSEKLSSLYIGPNVEEVYIEKDGVRLEIPFALIPDEDDFNEAHVFWLIPASPITTAGAYNIVVPSKAFVVGKYPSNWYVEGFDIVLTVNPEVGIEEMEATEPSDDIYYNLQGMPVSNPQKGNIYIHKARKVRM